MYLMVLVIIQGLEKVIQMTVPFLVVLQKNVIKSLIVLLIVILKNVKLLLPTLIVKV